METPELAVGEDDLYLAVEGSGTDGFSEMPETPLVGFAAEGEKITEMGALASGQEGSFQFKAKASREFLDKYMDSQFPLEGSGNMEEIRKNHYRTIDENTNEVKAENARAIYRMHYRLELDPPRRFTWNIWQTARPTATEQYLWIFAMKRIFRIR